MPKEPIRAPLGGNVPGLTMADFQLTLHGRFWVTPEAGRALILSVPSGFSWNRLDFYSLLPCHAKAAWTNTSDDLFSGCGRWDHAWPHGWR